MRDSFSSEKPAEAARGRVLFLSPQPYFEWRGSPIRVGFNVQALAELGFEVDLLVMPVGEEHDVPGVRVHRVPNVLGVTRLPIGPSPAKAILDLFLYRRARRMARERRYAVIHGVEEAGALAVLLARRTGARCVFEKHSDPVSHRGGLLRNAVLRLYARVEAWTIRRADAVIGTGEGLVEQARRFQPRHPPFHIFDIPSSLQPADRTRAAALRTQWLGDAPGPLVMYVGSFAAYQGVDLMFASIPRVVRALPGVRFAIIGGSPEEIARRTAELERQGAAGAVLFPDRVPPDELPHVLAAADILLSPRLAGANTPLKILDYFKAGGAIAACDTPANRLLLDARTAVLTPPDPAAFAEGILRLARDPGLRQALSEEGRKRIRDTYNFETFKAGLQACYAAILG